MKISYSAPAKAILSGEHAVVYGKPALVSAIDRRLYVSLWQSKKQNQDKVMLMIVQKVQSYLKKHNIPFSNKPFDFKITSEIPIGRGLGSSAALSVAVSAVFLEFFTGKAQDKTTINNVAYLAEKYFHVNASGVDPSTSCFGGLIYYRKEFEFLKTISALNFRIPEKIEKHLYLIDSGKPKESTAGMVRYVGKAYNRDPKIIENTFNQIEKVTKRIVVSITKEDPSFFKKNIQENQVLLEKLGVVSSKTKQLLHLLKNFGTGKITGAGGKKYGSGYLLFYSIDDKALEKYLEQKRIVFMKFKQDFEGVVKVSDT